MPRGRKPGAGLISARKTIEQMIKKSVGEIIKPYQKEISGILKDAAKLQSSLEDLASKITSDAAGTLRERRARVRRLSSSTRRKIAQAMKAAWAKRKTRAAA